MISELIRKAKNILTIPFKADMEIGNFEAEKITPDQIEQLVENDLDIDSLCKDCIVYPTGNCEKLCEKFNDVFPCAGCDKAEQCNELCDKIEKDNTKVKELFLKYGRCPDCGSDQYLEGPCGGLAQNIKCVGCGHEYNMGLPLFIERI